MQLAQGHTGSGALLVHRKFQCLHAVVQDAVQRLDVVARLVLQGADVLHDVVTGHVLGVDHAAQIQPGQNIVKFQTVDLGHQFAVGVLFGKQGQQHVLFVDVGQRHKGLGRFQTLGKQKLAVGAVLIQDLCAGQLLGQFHAAGGVPLHDAHPHMVFQQFLTEVVGNGTAAHDKSVAHRLHRQM